MANKDIEIPFGAYDSELDGFEYTIPEGYKAEIKDGKVVVKKTESEDEKIRKAIYNCVKLYGFDSCFFKDVSQEECLAWLEKQCKNNMGISEATKQKLEDSLNEALEKETPESCNEFLDKQGEQKPVYNGKHKLLTVERAKEMSPFMRSGFEHNPAETEKGANGNEREIPNSAWSEEDEKMLNEVILGLNVLKHKDSGEEEKAAYQREIDWLESLKDRVLPQPKQKWSKEDERIIDNLVSQLGNLYARKLIKEETKDKYVNWLKSLKPHSTWKPSEEQMKALRRMKAAIAGEGEIYNPLNSLYQDLKKLREE